MPTNRPIKGNNKIQIPKPTPQSQRVHPKPTTLNLTKSNHPSTKDTKSPTQKQHKKASKLTAKTNQIPRQPQTTNQTIQTKQSKLIKIIIQITNQPSKTNKRSQTNPQKKPKHRDWQIKPTQTPRNGGNSNKQQNKQTSKSTNPKPVAADNAAPN